MADVIERVRAWVTGAALPFWSDHGQDAQGLFYEQTDYAGVPDPGGFRRVRVQARQVWCLAHAREKGWHPAPGLERGFDAFLKYCWAPDGRPGWVARLNPEGDVIDATRDAYDHAFCLFALAGVHRTTGDPRAREHADKTLAFMDAQMADPFGGYRESLPPALPRRTNPHMHLLEAMLAWHDATGETAFLQRAEALVGLFEDRFFDKEAGCLGEYFDEELNPLPPPEGLSVEPGHHFEWTWLLHRHHAQGGRDLRARAQQLYRFGLEHGLDPAGFAVDECDKSGAQRRATRRTWPQAELLKAHLATGHAEDTRAAAERLLDGYLSTDTPGLWIDQFDAQGRSTAPVVPASTLYHLLVAFDQLFTLEGSSAAQP